MVTTFLHGCVTINNSEKVDNVTAGKLKKTILPCFLPPFVFLCIQQFSCLCFSTFTSTIQHFIYLTGNMQYGYFVVLVCFLVVALFASQNKSNNLAVKQGH